MKRSSLIIGVLLFSSLGFSQTRPIVPFRHDRIPLGPLTLSNRQALSGQDTVRVLALLVEFKPDNDPRTNGNGTFDTTAATAEIDPPPHDSAYFSQKLRFLRNYFGKVSNQQLVVRTDLFTSLVTLSDTMAVYSPPSGGSDQPLGRLVQDSWTAASNANPSFPFSSYDAFVIFHAGVGRDIDMISILGFDPTPNDIPSIFVDLASLRTFLNDPSYQGVPVNGGAFRITNSLVLPETETRVIGSGASASTLNLGINGLLAATFGSYLGLPDLFDTRTGATAIGQFGLMDGASIFAYDGLFPPEPSAWEKIYLGWTTPITLSAGTTTISLPATGLTTTGQDSIYKVPISSSEYFLIENRIRDPLGNGQTLTLIQNGQEVTRTFSADTTGFIFSDVSGITGSLVDAEDFDWALSGDMSQQGFEGGGILIWHIDEDVIRTNLQTNTINADPKHRGVDLEEADGSQDIGRSYSFLDPGSGTENGWPLDQWFQGNQAPPYRNAFDGTSHPNSSSNSGAPTLVSVRDFSPKAPRMSLTVQIGTTQLARMDSLTFSLGTSGPVSSPSVTRHLIAVSSHDSVFLFQPNGLSKVADPSGLLSPTGGRVPVAVLETNKTWVVGGQDSVLYVWDLDTTNDGISSSVTSQTINLGGRISAGPMIIDSAGTTMIVVGGASGEIWKIDLNGTLRSGSTGDGHAVLALSADALGSLFYVTSNALHHDQVSVSLPSVSNSWIMSAGQLPDGVLIAVGEQGGARLLGYDGSLAGRFDVQCGGGSMTALVVADANNDGNNDVLVASGHSLSALHFNGIGLDHFPRGLTDGSSIAGPPLVADLDDDGKKEVLFRSTNGVVYAYRQDGELVDGFPYQASAAGDGSLSLVRTTANRIGIMVVTTAGSVQSWEVNASWNPAPGDWTATQLDAGRTNFNANSPAVPVSGGTALMPKDRVYNWPNPVYGTTTAIRYYTPVAAAISVKIFDVAGSSVAELRGDSVGGVDGEITWDVSNIQSGVYLARVEASSGAQHDVAIIKIAVVK